MHYVKYGHSVFKIQQTVSSEFKLFSKTVQKVSEIKSKLLLNQNQYIY